MFTPSWKKYEEKIFKGSAKEQDEASDKFIQAREHEIRTDKKAKEWEEGRKKELAKAKPQWVKDQRRKETSEVDKLRKSLRVFGVSNENLIPASGYLLVFPEVIEQKTESGIVLPAESMAAMTNRGYVLEIGKSGITNDGRIVKQPCKKGDTILFKKGAGVEIKIKDKDCRFMQFSDVLGIFVK